MAGLRGLTAASVWAAVKWRTGVGSEDHTGSKVEPALRFSDSLAATGKKKEGEEEKKKEEEVERRGGGAGDVRWFEGGGGSGKVAAWERGKEREGKMREPRTYLDNYI
ncbi:uncharacterized protein LOC127265059 isoform X2 [Andrographis paniculata]|uniref:uncharacterized protein LOC127265059 isoform X2 n=1 Tax=Andrographis paniculata TaxID=175694 RepID=UPI0021E7B3BB|nr:uncharacterized protein LOC127265059 isoform X2 [Andrographis paniculata]